MPILKQKILKSALPFIILLAMVAGPYGQLFSFVLNGQSGCGMTGHCSCPMMAGNGDNEGISAECGCKVDKTPDLPNLPEGTEISHNALGHRNIHAPITGIPVPNNEFFAGLSASNTEPENSINSPPLYILNSSYLI